MIFRFHVGFLGCIRQYWIMNPPGIRGENSKKSLKPPPSRGQGVAAGRRIQEVVSFLEDHIIRKTLGFSWVFGAQEDVTVVSFKHDNNTQTTHDYLARIQRKLKLCGHFGKLVCQNSQVFPMISKQKTPPVFFFLFDTKVRSSIKKGMAQFGVTV